MRRVGSKMRAVPPALDQTVDSRGIPRFPATLRAPRRDATIECQFRVTRFVGFYRGRLPSCRTLVALLPRGRGDPGAYRYGRSPYRALHGDWRERCRVARARVDMFVRPGDLRRKNL